MHLFCCDRTEILLNAAEEFLPAQKHRSKTQKFFGYLKRKKNGGCLAPKIKCGKVCNSVIKEYFIIDKLSIVFKRFAFLV